MEIEEQPSATFKAEPLRIFVNDINSPVSQAIVEEIRNDHAAFDN